MVKIVPGCFGHELFWPGSFLPWVVSANFCGSFRPDFFKSPRLRIIGRTFIWLFDEESIVMSKAFFLSPSRLGLIDRTIIWLFDEESVRIIGRG